MGTSAMLTLIKLKRLNTRESEVLGAKKESLFNGHDSNGIW